MFGRLSGCSNKHVISTILLSGIDLNIKHGTQREARSQSCDNRRSVTLVERVIRREVPSDNAAYDQSCAILSSLHKQ